MIQWILIITIFSEYNAPIGVTSIAGIDSKEHCEAAFKDYVKAQPHTIEASHVCTQQTW